MLNYKLLRPAVQQSDLSTIAQYMLPLMLRNMSSEGWVFTDPSDPDRFSKPGCIIASPSYPTDLSPVTQNYVWNWTRDAALAAAEIARAPLPRPGSLDDYITFASTCQENAPGLDTACYTIDGQPREDWPLQNDGPALQALTVLQAFDQLNFTTQSTARAVIERDIDFVLANYQNPSFNQWEEVHGQSFFTRAVQLRCLTQLQSNKIGITVHPGTQEAIAWVQNALASHWNGQYYQSMLPVPADYRAPYDPNIDIVMAAIYGAVPVTDTRLLATAALLRSQWADPASPYFYPINGADQQRGIGPMLGRYPGDEYDGDLAATPGYDPPWARCTANFAELYHRLAKRITTAGTVPLDSLSVGFFSQVGVDASATPAAAAAALQNAGDQMLQASVYHSDNLELSEQFDAATGYEKGVRNLTLSYAAFLSAVRAGAR